MSRSSLSLGLEYYNTHRVYMLEHNRVMNVSNKDWIHVNRFIRNLLRQKDLLRISEVNTIAGLEPVYSIVS